MNKTLSVVHMEKRVRNTSDSTRLNVSYILKMFYQNFQLIQS